MFLSQTSRKGFSCFKVIKLSAFVCGNAIELQLIMNLRGPSNGTRMTFIPERVHSIPIYFSARVIQE